MEEQTQVESNRPEISNEIDDKSKGKSVYTENEYNSGKAQLDIFGKISYPSGIEMTSIPIQWGTNDPIARGPILASIIGKSQQMRNAIGAYSDSFGMHRALSVADGDIKEETISYDFKDFKSDDIIISEKESWYDPYSIVSFDPWGHLPQIHFQEEIQLGLDIQPTIDIRRTKIFFNEMCELYKNEEGTENENKIVDSNGEVDTIKITIDPVWWLPGVSKRFKLNETQLRNYIFEYTGYHHLDLISRSDLMVFLPTIGKTVLYIFGKLEVLDQSSNLINVGMHDECEETDIFEKSCSCESILKNSIKQCINSAQSGGVGIFVYFKKDGRKPGQKVARLLSKTKKTCQTQNNLIETLTPDVLNWLGIKEINTFIASASKYNVVQKTGIVIMNHIDPYLISDTLQD